jgi:hypothetical protein
VCRKCERATELAEGKKAKAADWRQKRDAEDLAHAKRLVDIDEKIGSWRSWRSCASAAEERTRAIQPKQKDLDTAKSRTSQAVVTSPISAGVSDAHDPPFPPASLRNSQPALSPQDTTRNPPRSVPTEPEAASQSQKDWERRKKVDGASNDAIDSIMELIGLEEVKEQVLSIYAKIEVTKRQGISLKDERFNIVLLGNPGTGWSYLSSSIA